MQGDIKQGAFYSGRAMVAAANAKGAGGPNAELPRLHYAASAHPKRNAGRLNRQGRVRVVNGTALPPIPSRRSA